MKIITSMIQESIELYKLKYTGTINPIYRYLDTLNEEKTLISRRSTVRFETPVGDQKQFNWGEYILLIVGGKTKYIALP